MKNPIFPKYPNFPKSPKNPNDPNLPNRPGYAYLACYQLGLVIQELTEQFTKRWIQSPRRRQQMDEASRSNPQNVAEGYTQESLKGYIYLSGIARGSNEELQQDYRNFLLYHKYDMWPITHRKIREFREFRATWISPTTLNSPNLPNDPQEAANLLLTLCNMEGYLLKRLIESLLEKHKTDGGLTERLYQERKTYRGYGKFLSPSA